MIVGGWRGPGWQVFGADPGCGREVRDWVRHVIAAHDCPVDLDDVTLAVGELFANAVTYGPVGGQVLVGYCLWCRGARIVVCDGGGPGVPRVRESAGLAEGGLAEGGWGLRVVESVSARWGAFHAGQAQVVWCDFGEPLRAVSTDAWAWLHAVLARLSLSSACAEGVAGPPSRLR